MNATQTATTGTGYPKPEPRGEAQISNPAPGARALPVTEQQIPASTVVPLKHVSPKQPTTARRRWLATVAVVGMTMAVLAGARFWLHARDWEKTDSAYVAAHIHTVSTRVAGTVKDVLVEENQAVEAGTVLARLDPGDFEVRKQQAQAQLAQAQAQEGQANAQISQARARVASEQARATRARNDLDRALSLFQDGAGAVSRQELDQAQAESDAAQAGLQGARAALDGALTLAEAAQAQEQAAHANLREAELQLSYTRILAPATGRVGKKNLEVGNRVQPGQALLALVQPEVWVTANFKETQLARMKAGQPATVKLDAFSGRTFSGTVESLSPASGSQFALLPPDNATGNFTRIVQRVPVRIRFDGQSLAAYAGRVVSGMSAVVEVMVRE